VAKYAEAGKKKNVYNDGIWFDIGCMSWKDRGDVVNEAGVAVVVLSSTASRN
jgi:hypothetical protein